MVVNAGVIKLTAGKGIRKTASSHNHKGVYVVKSGDTLVRIAKAHCTTINVLKTTNHLTRGNIFVGERWKMPQTNSADPNSA